VDPVIAYLLYAIFALGGAGLYFALPKTQPRRVGIAGLLLGAGAIIGGLMLLGTRVMGPSPTNLYFYIFGAMAVFTAARVVTHAKPVYSAVYFVALVVAVAALVVLEGAEFLAIALIIVYAGAILVTYAFVIMLAQQSDPAVCDTHAREPFAGVLIGFVAMAAVAGRIADPNAVGSKTQEGLRTVTVAQQADGPRSDASTPSGSLGRPQTAAPAGSRAEEGNTVAVGRALFGHYVVAIQLAGVLLLVGMVGALALVRKKVPRDVPSEPPIEIGEAGKEVQPF
jgi:NADH-quinone oxidoreductase subunit J